MQESIVSKTQHESQSQKQTNPHHSTSQNNIQNSSLLNPPNQNHTSQNNSQLMYPSGQKQPLTGGIYSTIEEDIQDQIESMLLRIQDQARQYCLVGETHNHTTKELKALKRKYETHKNPIEEKTTQGKRKVSSMEHQLYIMEQKISQFNSDSANYRKQITDFRLHAKGFKKDRTKSMEVGNELLVLQQVTNNKKRIHMTRAETLFNKIVNGISKGNKTKVNILEELNIMDRGNLQNSLLNSKNKAKKPDYFYLKEMENWEMDLRGALKNRIKNLSNKNIYKKEMIQNYVLRMQKYDQAFENIKQEEGQDDISAIVETFERLYDKNSQIYQKEYFLQEDLNEVTAKLSELKMTNVINQKICKDLGLQEMQNEFSMEELRIKLKEQLERLQFVTKECNDNYDQVKIQMEGFHTLYSTKQSELNSYCTQPQNEVEKTLKSYSQSAYLKYMEQSINQLVLYQNKKQLQKQIEQQMLKEQLDQQNQLNSEDDSKSRRSNKSSQKHISVSRQGTNQLGEKEKDRNNQTQGVLLKKKSSSRTESGHHNQRVTLNQRQNSSQKERSFRVKSGRAASSSRQQNSNSKIQSYSMNRRGGKTKQLTAQQENELKLMEELEKVQLVVGEQDFTHWKPKMLNLSVLRDKNRKMMMNKYMSKYQNSMSTELGKLPGFNNNSSAEDSMDKSTMIMNSKSQIQQSKSQLLMKGSKDELTTEVSEDLLPGQRSGIMSKYQQETLDTQEDDLINQDDLSQQEYQGQGLNSEEEKMPEIKPQEIQAN